MTRSGGDRLHGQMLELWRPADTQAQLAGFTGSNATSGNEVTSDVLGQTAASLSGSAGSSHALHFFTAGEYNREARRRRSPRRSRPAAFPMAVLLFVHSIYTDPNLKDGHPDLLDGGKIFLEIAALLTVAAVGLRVRLRGRGLRPQTVRPRSPK